MLTLRTARLVSPLRVHVRTSRTTDSKVLNFRRELSTLHALSEGFFDLALALPLPVTWPPYSSTIIIVTVVTRLIWTVPFSVWAKQRQWRVEEKVMPELERAKPVISHTVIKEMHDNGVVGSKDDLREKHAKRYRQLMKLHREQLLKEYRCRPLITMLIPPLTQMPLFVGMSMVMNRAAQMPTPLDTESFFTLTTLTHADPTATLPIILGVITLANVESSRWFINQEALEREKKVEQWNAEKRAKGHLVLEPKKIVQSGLRIFSVGRILIGAMVPGTVVLYWVTSAAFGLVQTWMLDWYDARRRRIFSAKAPLPPLPLPSGVRVKPKAQVRKKCK